VPNGDTLPIVVPPVKVCWGVCPEAQLHRATK